MMGTGVEVTWVKLAMREDGLERLGKEIDIQGREYQGAWCSNRGTNEGGNSESASYSLASKNGSRLADLFGVREWMKSGRGVV